MVHLPVLVAAAVGLATLVGVWHPAIAFLAGVAGALAGLLAGAAFWRAAPRLGLAAALAGIAALAAARGAVAFDAASRPSLVAVLDAAGALVDGEPRARPPVLVSGRLVADAAVEGPVVLLRVAVERVALGPCYCPLPVDGTVLMAVAGGLAPSQAEQWRAGRSITVTATVRRAVTYRNRGGPDAAHELVRRRVALTASVKSALLVEEVRPGRWPEELAATLRARTRRAIARAAGRDGAVAAAIGTAVLIGDRSGLDAELTDRLQRAGTFHVIAISGGNIALLAVLAAWTCGWLFGRGRLALALTAFALVSYAFVVGGEPSVLRATGMAVVGLTARTLDHRGTALNVLALTGAALLAADPLLAVDTGFWLSTAATAGLIVGLGEARGAPRWRQWTRALVLTSVWAELALLPLVALAFEQVTLAGVLLSAVAIPGMALAQMAAMAAVAADAVAPWLLGTAGLTLRLGAAMVTESARLVDVVPVATWRVPPPHMAAVCVYYALLGAWLWTRVPGTGAGRAWWRPRVLGALALMALWVAIHPPSLVQRSRQLEVAVLDVGQGDAIFLRFPNRRTMLVDTGGRAAGSRFDVGARVVTPALRARGVRRLDLLVITHADLDHIGGAVSLVEQFRPREVWLGVPVADDAATAALRRVADARGAAWRTLQRGDRLEMGAVDLHVLHPPPPDWERQRVRNDDSVVLAATFGGVRVLLTGDIGAAVEPEVAAAARRLDDADQAGPRLTVLKVAHHGSAGSTTSAFLAALRPAGAVVSAGLDDAFGHPSPQALDRLTAADVEVWRTDRDGEVTLRTDGRDVELTTFSGTTRRWTAPRPSSPP